MQSLSKVALFGATGMLGNPVSRVLAEQGFELSALVRSIHKARKILSPSIKLIEGDLRREEGIRKVLTGADAVYLSLSVKPDEKPQDFHPELDGLRLILKIAQEEGVRRVLYLSSIIKEYRGFNWWVFDLKRQAVQMIKESGMEYTIFHPSNFMETLSQLNLQGNRLILTGRQQTRSYWISASDFGLQVANALRRPETVNQEYMIQGPSALSYDEAADQFMAHYPHKKLRKIRVPLGLLKFFSHFNQQAQYGSKIMEAINKYDERFAADRSWEQLGRPQTDIKSFVERL